MLKYYALSKIYRIVVEYVEGRRIQNAHRPSWVHLVPCVYDSDGVLSARRRGRSERPAPATWPCDARWDATRFTCIWFFLVRILCYKVLRVRCFSTWQKCFVWRPLKSMTSPRTTKWSEVIVSECLHSLSVARKCHVYQVTSCTCRVVLSSLSIINRSAIKLFGFSNSLLKFLFKLIKIMLLLCL